MKKYSAIILAAGSGSRMGLGYNKILHMTNQKPAVLYSLETFLADNCCVQLILVINPLEAETIKKIIPLDERILMISGGDERQDSVYQGLQQVTEAVVLVHDGARIFVNQTMIDECYRFASIGVAAVVGVPVKDTVKRVNEERVVLETLPRQELFSIQTPQSAPTHLLKLAHEKAKVEQFLGTDEASLIERYTNIPVHIVKGSYRNIKLTTPEDLLIAEQLLHYKEKNS